MSIIYHFYRAASVGPAHVTVSVNGEGQGNLDPRHDIRSHSPDGFQWGFGGSGPAQLALALCCHVLEDDDRAQRIYQRFKRRVLVAERRDAWSMTWGEIVEAIDVVEKDGSR